MTPPETAGRVLPEYVVIERTAFSLGIMSSGVIPDDPRPMLEGRFHTTTDGKEPRLRTIDRHRRSGFLWPVMDATEEAPESLLRRHLTQVVVGLAEDYVAALTDADLRVMLTALTAHAEERG